MDETLRSYEMQTTPERERGEKNGEKKKRKQNDQHIRTSSGEIDLGQLDVQQGIIPEEQRRLHSANENEEEETGSRQNEDDRQRKMFDSIKTQALDAANITIAMGPQEDKNEGRDTERGAKPPAKWKYLMMKKTHSERARKNWTG